MITKLEIENFYSIKDKHVLDFTVPATTPKSSRYRNIDDYSSLRAPTVVAIFGANGSGKTTVLRAASFIRHFVTNSFDDYKPDDKVNYQAFACESNYKEPSSIAIEFTTGKDESVFGCSSLRYELVIKTDWEKTVVQKEELHAISSKGDSRRIFRRYLRNGETRIDAAKDFDLAPSDPRRSVRDNVSLVSSLVQFAHKPSTDIQRTFKRLFFYNVSVGKLQNDEKTVTKFLDGSPPYLDLLNKTIRRIDLGITKVEIETLGDGQKIPVFYHQGLDYPRTFGFESQGTQSFYLNFIDIFAAMSLGGVAIMDELDADLHPNLMSEVIRWFHSDIENKEGAQLFLTCHNSSIIADLEKEEVWLAEKNDSGETSIRGIKEFSGIRRDTNLYAKYMSGAFGGVPRFG